MWDTAIGGEPQRLMKTHQVLVLRRALAPAPAWAPSACCRRAHLPARPAPACARSRPALDALPPRAVLRCAGEQPGVCARADRARGRRGAPPPRAAADVQRRLTGAGSGAQVDFHRLPVGHCPEDTPGCAKSHQADRHIVLASDRRPRNYVYNYFTDEGDAAKDVTKVRARPACPGLASPLFMLATTERERERERERARAREREREPPRTRAQPDARTRLLSNAHTHTGSHGAVHPPAEAGAVGSCGQ